MINVNYEVLSCELCDGLIASYEKNADNAKTSDIASDNPKLKQIRNSKELTLEWEDVLAQNALELLKPLIDKYISSYPDVAKAFHSSYYEPIRLLKYKAHDGFYNFHFDTDGDDIKNRVLSIVMYLNDVEAGGCTSFRNFENQEVEARKGKIVIFPSGWTHTHQGNMPRSNDKYVCVTWLRKTENKKT